MIINQDLYDGLLLKSRFAYEYFRDTVSPYGNIVSFRAPMLVDTNLIDLEDSLEKDYIFSDDAVNFCWEIPNLCPLGAVAFQRLFNTEIANILSDITNKTITMRGDDLIVREIYVDRDLNEREHGKVSVSITYSKDNVALGHTGINIQAGTKAPIFAYSSKLNDAEVTEFQSRVIGAFNWMVKDMFTATTKISL